MHLLKSKIHEKQNVLENKLKLSAPVHKNFKDVYARKLGPCGISR